jgi:tRNA nucleotidyltransferase (CCA-adding enzyme)
MTIEDACRRRDLRMNAMMINAMQWLDGHIEIIDPFNGKQDIKEKKLRAVDKILFLDDPLRFFRVMQFIGRFEMEPDNELNNICKHMEIEVSKERVFEEIKKLLLKSKRPSLGLRWLLKIGRLQEVFPQLHNLVGIKQRSDYHPEGDVFEHTMQALDAAAKCEKFANEDEKFLIMLGVLCHDLGKPITTDDKLSTVGHETKGVPLCKQFLKIFTDDTFLIPAVCKLVRYHLRPLQLFEQKSSLKAYKRLAAKLAPQINLRQLALLSLCDLQGRNPKGSQPLENKWLSECMQFLEIANKAQVMHGPEKPVLLGRHLIGVVEQGPKMGEILKRAYDIQIDEGIKDIEVLKARVLSDYNK